MANRNISNPLVIKMFDRVVNHYAYLLKISVPSALDILCNGAVQKYFSTEVVIYTQSEKEIVENLLAFTLGRDEEDLRKGEFSTPITEDEIDICKTVYHVDVELGYKPVDLTKHIREATTYIECYEQAAAILGSDLSRLFTVKIKMNEEFRDADAVSNHHIVSLDESKLVDFEPAARLDRTEIEHVTELGSLTDRLIKSLTENVERNDRPIGFRVGRKRKDNNQEEDKKQLRTEL